MIEGIELNIDKRENTYNHNVKEKNGNLNQKEKNWKIIPKKMKKILYKNQKKHFY